MEHELQTLLPFAFSYHALGNCRDCIPPPAVQQTDHPSILLRVNPFDFTQGKPERAIC